MVDSTKGLKHTAKDVVEEVEASEPAYKVEQWVEASKKALRIKPRVLLAAMTHCDPTKEYTQAEIEALVKAYYSQPAYRPKAK